LPRRSRSVSEGSLGAGLQTPRADRPKVSTRATRHSKIVESLVSAAAASSITFPFRDSTPRCPSKPSFLRSAHEPSSFCSAACSRVTRNGRWAPLIIAPRRSMKTLMFHGNSPSQIGPTTTQAGRVDVFFVAGPRAHNPGGVSATKNSASSPVERAPALHAGCHRFDPYISYLQSRIP
jgi:hypothetical protein